MSSTILNKAWLIIPARKGSKGLIHKNRHLLLKTLETIPKMLHSRTIVTSDDDWIIQKSSSLGFDTQIRSEENSTDTASTRDVLIEVANRAEFKSDDIVILLYLTFPERTFSDIQKSLEFFEKESPRSMLCQVKPETHPYLCLYSDDNMKGRQIVKHDMCRRQEYPECFVVSHYISIFVVSEMKLLNRNMYNENTVFYPINSPLDIDTLEDYRKIGK